MPTCLSFWTDCSLQVHHVNPQHVVKQPLRDASRIFWVTLGHEGHVSVNRKLRLKVKDFLLLNPSLLVSSLSSWIASEFHHCGCVLLLVFVIFLGFAFGENQSPRDVND